METSDLALVLRDVSVDLSKGHIKVPKTIDQRQQFLPRLRTGQPLDRPRTQRQALLTLQKRNMDTPDNNVPIDLNKLKRVCLERFLTTFCVPDARARLAEFKEQRLGITKSALKDWAALS